MNKGRYSITTQMAVMLLESFDARDYPANLVLTFNITPERSATYLQPGEGATAEIITAHVGDEEAPNWLWEMIERDELIQSEMLAEARETDESARDHYADMAREERLMDAHFQGKAE